MTTELKIVHPTGGMASARQLNASMLASMADEIMGPSSLTMNCPLMPVEACQDLLAASAEQPNALPHAAADLVVALMGSYRKSEFQDPDIFAAGCAANFADFPLSIGRQVVDPTKGLPSTLKFPPSIAEVRSALDAALARRRAISYRARWHLEERARRDEEAARTAAQTPEHKAEMAAKLAALSASLGTVKESPANKGRPDPCAAIRKLAQAELEALEALNHAPLEGEKAMEGET